MNDKKILKIGMIGSGAITRFIHVPGFQLCPDVQVAVACDSIFRSSGNDCSHVWHSKSDLELPRSDSRS